MSSNVEIVAQKIENTLYAAVIQQKKTIDLYADSKAIFPLWGSVYLGKVEKIDTVLDGAFVSLGGNQQGFLPAKHVYKKNIETKNDSISTLLKPGQPVIVQIKSEAKEKTEHEHQKQPRLTMKLYIHGRALLYSPTANKVTISRYIDDKDVLKLAYDLKSKGGWIFRDAAEHTDLTHLQTEADYLQSTWDHILGLAKENEDTPRLLYQGPDAVCRAMVDYAAHTVTRIDISDDCNTDKIKTWCEYHAPGLCQNIYTEPSQTVDLFDMRDVYGALGSALETRVDLKDGGSLIIEHAHACTIIDVNRGSASDIKALNLQAAREVARQIKLRNMSGAILIDFINLRLKSDRYHLVETLEKHVGQDPGNTHVHGFTRLGMMEITRTRRTATLLEKHHQD